jgi:hypothetical protein
MGYQSLMSHSTTVVQATDNRQIEVRFFLGQPNKGVSPQGEAADCNSVAEKHVRFDS